MVSVLRARHGTHGHSNHPTFFIRQKSLVFASNRQSTHPSAACQPASLPKKEPIPSPVQIYVFLGNR